MEIFNSCPICRKEAKIVREELKDFELSNNYKNGHNDNTNNEQFNFRDDERFKNDANFFDFIRCAQNEYFPRDMEIRPKNSYRFNCNFDKKQL